jgi:RNA polymerase sigma-70 factor (ECF subfamily)
MTSSAASPSGRIAESENRWRTYVGGIRARDSEALAQLYDETSGILYSFAVRMLNDAADAEEVVLDVYQQVWKSIDTFDASRGSVLAWLTVLTRSRSIDRLRRAGPRRARETAIDQVWEAPSPTPAPEAQSMFQQERRMVRRALEELAPEQREAIELAFFRGLTHVEVAEALGTPLGTIKTRIRVGMRKLRDTLAPLASAEGLTG